MKTIILEGMSTSGKTTIMEKLVELLAVGKIKYRVLTENETFWPCLSDDDPQKSIDYFKNLITEISKEDERVLILDRSYFTHIMITNSQIAEFKEVEEMILPLNPLLVCLTIKDEKIGERIFASLEHRNESWKELVESKGGQGEATKWFKKTQDKLLKLYDQTKLPKIKFDTTDLNYDKIAGEIFERYLR